MCRNDGLLEVAHGCVGGKYLIADHNSTGRRGKGEGLRDGKVHIHNTVDPFPVRVGDGEIGNGLLGKSFGQPFVKRNVAFHISLGEKRLAAVAMMDDGQQRRLTANHRQMLLLSPQHNFTTMAVDGNRPFL